MPVADRKVIERVEKLLRLAAPASNTTEPERVSAALEAARLFSAHDLEVREAKSRRKAKARDVERYEDAPPRATPPPPGWGRSFAVRDSYCADPECREPIARGDDVWMRMSGFEAEYLHFDGPCGW